MLSPDQYYLKIGRASDLKDKKERRIYRFFETLPGLSAWITLLLVFLFSWRWPVVAVIFIVFFDTYWFFKTLYFTLHGVHTFRVLRKNLKINWLEKIENLDKSKYNLEVDSWKDVYHLVVLPMSIEGYDVLESTFESLSKTDYPKDKMIVVLATEERKKEIGREVSKKIQEKFGDRFFKLFVAEHPDGIEGELAGKSANQAWATRRVKEEIIDPLGLKYENILISVFDSDTVVEKGYFSLLTYSYLIAEDPLHSSFQPIPFFTNNIWQAPALARVISFSATFFQFIQQSRPEKMTTFSSHSMPFKALVDIDFWQVNVVSEDSRIFWQNFFFYDGNWNVIPLFYPVSMDANVASSFWQTMVNQYKQQRRWGYGSENMPYTFFGFLKNKKIPAKKKWSWGFLKFEGYYSWATSALMIFLLGWLPTFLGGSRFRTTLLSFNLPEVTSRIMLFAMIGLIVTAFISFWFLPPRPPKYGRWRYVIFLAQWILLPFNLIVFGCIAALDAQTRLMLGKYMGFWVTPKHRKKED